MWVLGIEPGGLPEQPVFLTFELSLSPKQTFLWGWDGEAEYGSAHL